MRLQCTGQVPRLRRGWGRGDPEGAVIYLFCSPTCRFLGSLLFTLFVYLFALAYKHVLFLFVVVHPPPLFFGNHQLVVHTHGSASPLLSLFVCFGLF